jgi:hypothetical protein
MELLIFKTNPIPGAYATWLQIFRSYRAKKPRFKEGINLCPIHGRYSREVFGTALR